MLPDDLELCREALDTMSSPTYSSMNYLFLEPVDTTYFTDYLTLVKRPMDFRTLRENLEAKKYATRQQFFQDALLICENAITFNAPKKEQHFVVKLAKAMMKLVQKERKKVERKAEKMGIRGSSTGTKAKAEASGMSSSQSPAAASNKATTKTATTGTPDSAPTTKKEKKTLKLRLGGSGSTKSKQEPKKQQESAKEPVQSAPEQNAAAPPKNRLKISSSFDSKSSGNKPKLKLSLSLNKKASVAGDAPPATREEAPSTTIRSGSKEGTTAGKKTKKKNSPKRKTETKSPATAAAAATAAAKPVAPSSGSTATSASAPPVPAAPTSAPTTTPSKSSKPKIRLTTGVSRGKELPKGVVNATAPAAGNKAKEKTSAPKSTESKKKKTASSGKSSKATTTPAATAPASKAKGAATTAVAKGTTSTATVASMTTVWRAQCIKVLSGLKRRKSSQSHPFLKPVSLQIHDKVFVDDYNAKIPHPMDFSTITNKLLHSSGNGGSKNSAPSQPYATVGDFCLDMRRVCGNCLRFNTGIKDEYREMAVELLATSEDLMAYFLNQSSGGQQVYPKLPYCWKLCISILDDLLSLVNPMDGHQTAHYFLHPVSFFCGGSFPADYAAKVKKPIDLGTITSNLVEGKYQTVEAFVADCRLVCENSYTYYSDREDGALFMEQASRLQTRMTQQLGALVRYDKSPEANQARLGGTVSLKKPPKSLLLSILKELKETKYLDRDTQISEMAVLPFEKPVDLVLFPDYRQYVEMPMDLDQVERKSQAGAYETPEDFEYDVTLIFRNCEAYNIPKRHAHIVALGKHGSKAFRKLFAAKMRSFEGGGSPLPQAPKSTNSKGTGSKALASKAATSKAERKRPASPGTAENRPKKVQRLESKSLSSKALSAGKSAAPMSLSAESEPKPQAKPQSKPQVKPQKSAEMAKKKAPPPVASGPVPLHVAITQVKERFSPRRPYKLLDGWEAACGRFFRELMRHPWISAARPTFIFHVPVPVLFPEIKDAYAAKVERPMDLTTAEAKLLQGGRYNSAQEFVADVALVFANAITFNREGHDLGEPMSCAYYEASKHLLRYSRWLSLEFLSSLLSDVADDDDILVGDPPVRWKLSVRNRKKSREEMEAIVMNENIEKSIEGDRYTWMESECEKLLKALRHQSDLRHMTFFIQPNYPADYAAFISKPMDWEQCNRTLQQRTYQTFGDLVEDLRLIFSNALKYNARAKGTDTVSGRAYEAAIFMSAKLELAVDKMLLSVSDRLEREKVDQHTAEREFAAAEKAEQERLHAQWRKDKEEGKGTSTTARVQTVQTVRLIQRRPPKRMDFDFPFNDEDEEQHGDNSNLEGLFQQQKQLFEKQRAEYTKLQRTSKTVGIGCISRLAQHMQAVSWAESLQQGIESSDNSDRSPGRPLPSHHNQQKASSVAAVLNRNDRQQIRVALQPKKKPRKEKKRPKSVLLLDEF